MSLDNLNTLSKALNMKVSKQNSNRADEVKKSLKIAVEELNLVKEGRMRGYSKQELFDEL